MILENTIELALLPTEQYWIRLLWSVKKRMGLNGLSDEQLIERMKSAYVKWQFYPLGYGAFDSAEPYKHHQMGDEPTDDWFISRIYEEIHSGPKCD